MVRVDPGRPGSSMPAWATGCSGVRPRASRGRRLAVSRSVDDVLTGSPASPAVILVRANAGLFRSDDDGVRWTSIGDGLQDTVIWNVVMDAASRDALPIHLRRSLRDNRCRRALATDGFAWHAALGSVDDDRRWGQSGNLADLDRRECFASTDAGNTWRRVPHVVRPATADDDRWKASRPDGQIPRDMTVVPGDPLRALCQRRRDHATEELVADRGRCATWQHADDCSPRMTTYACHAIVDPNDSQVIYEYRRRVAGGGMGDGPAQHRRR